jgi:hypothetical protein
MSEDPLGDPSRRLSITDRQAQKKFKHARVFGVEGPYTRENAERFKVALAAHAADPVVEVSAGILNRGTRGESRCDFSCIRVPASS